MQEIERVKAELRVPVIWMIGVHGSGIDEQLKRIKYKYKLHDISPASVMKKEMESRSPRGKQLAECILKDTLPPENVLFDMYRDEIKEYMKSTNGFYMGHFPLTVDQGKFFEDLVSKQFCIFYMLCIASCHKMLINHSFIYFDQVAPVALILYFHCHESVLKQRMLQGKKSNYNVELQTLKRFLAHATPVLDFYDKRIVKINTDGTPDEVFKTVSKSIDNLYKGTKYIPKLAFNTKKYPGK